MFNDLVAKMLSTRLKFISEFVFLISVDLTTCYVVHKSFFLKLESSSPLFILIMWKRMASALLKLSPCKRNINTGLGQNKGELMVTLVEIIH